MPIERKTLIEFLKSLLLWVIVGIFFAITFGCQSIPPEVIEAIMEELDQPAPTPAPEAVPTATPEPKEDDGIFPPASAAKSGRFLWKPESETERGVAILLPWQERGYIEEIAVTWQVGEIRIPRHKTNERWVNGARPHFFTYRHRSVFGTQPVTITAQRTDGQVRRWIVANPQVRDER